MSKRPGRPLKVFHFFSSEYRPARWLYIDEVHVAAASLAEAKQILAEAHVHVSRDDYRAVPGDRDDEPVALALANPGAPVWRVPEHDSPWMVGGAEVIESYIRNTYGDGPYPRML